jgi:enoyl-CoA hydratase/carnithine racemase
MTPDEFEQIAYQVTDNVATVTLNRPSRRNAWTGRMALEYRWALATAENDSSVGAIVVTGADGAFCVGADAQILADVDSAGGAYQRAEVELPPFPDDAVAGLRHNHTYPLALSKPVIAAINGACAGAGFVVATFADIRLAVEGAKITPSFAGLGLPAEYGIAWVLPRVVGLQNALDMMFTNAVLPAEEARELGYVRRVFARATFVEQVETYARNIAQHSSPASLAVMKRQLYVDANLDLETAYVRSVADMDRMIAGPDFSEGLRALRERRPPVFRADGAPAAPPEK